MAEIIRFRAGEFITSSGRNREEIVFYLTIRIGSRGGRSFLSPYSIAAMAKSIPSVLLTSSSFLLSHKRISP